MAGRDAARPHVVNVDPVVLLKVSPQRPEFVVFVDQFSEREDSPSSRWYFTNSAMKVL